MATPEQWAQMQAMLEVLQQQMAAMAMAQAAGAPAATSLPAAPPTQSQVPEESWQRQPRNPRGAFSPGYGVRGTEVDDGPASDLVSEAGTVHRVYPAPTEQSPPLNQDKGWPNPEPPTINPVTPAPQYKTEASNPKNQSISGATSPSVVLTPPQTPEQESTSQVQSTSMGDGSYIGWEPVVYQDPRHNEADPDAGEGLLDCLAGMREKREAARAAAGGATGFSRPQDQGYGPRPALDDGECHCGLRAHVWSCPVYNFGGGGKPCRTCGDEEHAARDCPRNKRDDRSDIGGFGSGRGGCFNRGQDGHMSRDCLEQRKEGIAGGGFGAPKSGACHKCGEEGHWSRECPQGGGGGKGCFNCGQEGHMSRECAEPRKGKSCYNCGQEGHTSRDCQEPRKDSVDRPPRQHDLGYGGGGGGGWDASPVIEGWEDGPSHTAAAPIASDQDGWEVSNKLPATNGQANAWESPSAPDTAAPATQESQPTSDSWDAQSPSKRNFINPDRLRMMRRGGAPLNGPPRQNGQRQASGYERDRPVPLRQDNGWGSRAQSITPEPVPVRESTLPPPPVANDEFGGW